MLANEVFSNALSVIVRTAAKAREAEAMTAFLEEETSTARKELQEAGRSQEDKGKMQLFYVLWSICDVVTAPR